MSSSLTPIEPPLNGRPGEEPEESTNAAPPQSKWVPTPQALEKLLAAFDSDRDKAGKQYVIVRVKLLRYFERRHVVEPERYADETMDRVMRRLDEGKTIVNMMAYIYGVASFVLKESIREGNQVRQALLEMPEPISVPQPNHEGEGSRQLCFDKCLSELPDESRLLILGYYDDMGTMIQLRRRMAKELGTSPNALRIRAHRTRLTLETCVKECVAQLA